MNPKIAEKLEKAKALLPLDESDVEEFIDLLEDVTGSGDPSVVGPILLLADDDMDLSGVMQSMLDLLEVFSPSDYAAGFLGVLEEFAERSPAWCCSELRKILWSNEIDALYSKAAEASPSTKSCLVATLENVGKETPQLAQICDQLLTRLRSL